MAGSNDTWVVTSVIVFLLAALAANGIQSPPKLRIPEACNANDPGSKLFVTCTFSHLHNHKTFNELEGTGIDILTVYFKDDIFHGTLPDDIFKRMPRLMFIAFFGNYPRHISKRAFAGLKHLKWLEIGRVAAQVFGGEQVTGLPLTDPPPLLFSHGWLNYIPALTSLDLAYNNIKSFPTGYLCGLKYLEELFLGNNDLSVPEDIGISNTHDPSQPPGCLARLTNLELSRNSLVSLKGTLGSLQSLIQLQVQYNRLEDIDDACTLNNVPNIKEPNFLPCLPSLLHLDMSHNFIRRLRIIHPCNSSKLEGLYLQHNRLEYISPGFFTCNRNLRRLDLSANSLTNDSLFDARLGDLNKLLSLKLSSNNIQTLQATLLSNMEKLERLICINCQIHTIEDNAFKNTVNLNTITLRNNSIQFISSRAFIYLQRLHTLDLSNNKLQAFMSTKVLSLLTHLYVSGNSLQRIPDFSGKWSNLTHLDLSRNSITQIEHKRLYGLSKLQSLKLGFNQIKYVPLDVFSSFATQLKTLNMDNNGLLSINVSTISGMTKLTDVSLAHNNIDKLGYWLPTPPLRYLNMSGNSLSEISSEYLPDSLETIDFSWNLIAKIQSSNKLPRLLQLNLAYNKLYKLNQSCFDMVSRENPRPQIQLEGNMLYCDCQIDWLLGIDPRKRFGPEIPDLNLVYCKPPESDGNRSLSVLTSLDLLCPYSDCNQRTCSCCKEKAYCPCYTFCLKGCTCLKGSEESNVDIMNCTSRNVSVLPFQLFSSAEAIYLDGNDLTDFISPDINFPQVERLFLNNSRITMIRVGVNSKLRTIKELYLQDNDIQELSQLSLNNLTQLERLYLHNNKISQIERGSLDQLDSLKSMSLHNNSLKRVDTTLFDNLKSLKNLTLHGNPWGCNCKTGPLFQKWLINKSKIISNIERITCRFKTCDQTIRDIDFSSCTPDWKVKGLTLLVFILVVIGCLMLLIYRRRLLLKILLYNHYGPCFHRNSDSDSNKLYDVFIAHAEEDEDFVLDNFLPELEERDRHYKVCLEMRDCLAGTVITEFIVSAIQSSKRIVLIVSEGYFNSKLAQYMFQVAHYQVLADRQLRLIPVLVGQNLEARMSSDLNLYMISRTFLRYGERNFWNRLRYYLGDNGSTPVIGDRL